jgi:hypothetical protein
VLTLDHPSQSLGDGPRIRRRSCEAGACLTDDSCSLGLLAEDEHGPACSQIFEELAGRNAAPLRALGDDQETVRGTLKAKCALALERARYADKSVELERREQLLLILRERAAKTTSRLLASSGASRSKRRRASRIGRGVTRASPIRPV